MKICLSLLGICFLTSTAFSQETRFKNPKNCYEEYYEAFITRGADPVKDGEHNVVISLRTDTGCYCGEGKITVKDGRITPSLLIKKVDGTYEKAKRKIHPNMNQGEVTSQAQYEVYKGMSHTFQTETRELADVFFIDALKRKVVADATAPSPNDIAGIQIELPANEKAVIQKAYEGLQFDNGKATIKKSSYPHLNLLVQMMMDHLNYKLDIKGYTDNVGSAESNLDLSRRRALAVKQYLVDRGMQEERITSQGFGMENPIADNNTKEGKAKNRRVEFVVKQ